MSELPGLWVQLELPDQRVARELPVQWVLLVLREPLVQQV
jgi:hypothetical protein